MSLTFYGVRVHFDHGIPGRLKVSREALAVWRDLAELPKHELFKLFVFVEIGLHLKIEVTVRPDFLDQAND